MGWLNRMHFSWKQAVGMLWIFVQTMASGPSLLGIADQPDANICIVVGAPGEPEYGKMFDQWRMDWSQALAGSNIQWIGQAESNTNEQLSDYERLRQWIESVESNQIAGTYWLVLIGHGTHDSKSTKFNLRGVDVSAAELSGWIASSKHQWVIAVCASSSGPFLQSLSREGRTIITATKSGSESNFSRFGGYLAKCFGDLNSDLDHDRSVSVLEAFVAASRQTERYYQENKLLATEHALIDDNADGKGTSVDFFRGLRAIKSSDKGAIDGELARRTWLQEPASLGSLGTESKVRIDEIESQLEALRSKKSTMLEDQYYADLERLMVELAKILYPVSK